MFFILLYFFEIIFKKVHIWKCSDFKFVQIRFFVRISNLNFDQIFEFFKIRIMYRFWICSNSKLFNFKFVQIWNYSTLNFCSEFEKMFEFYIFCSGLKFVQIQILFRFWKNVQIWNLFAFSIFVLILKKSLDSENVHI